MYFESEMLKGFFNFLDSEMLSVESYIKTLEEENKQLKEMLGITFKAESISTKENSITDNTKNVLYKEKDILEFLLKKHKGYRRKVAADMDISERTLYRKLAKYNLQ